MKKEDIFIKLGKFPCRMEGFWLVTGAALVMFGVREETEDIDLGCTAEAADRLEADGYLYRVMEDGNRWLKIDHETEVFENWLCGSVEILDGVPVVSLQGLREMKRRLGREKDLRDIRQIDAFLARSEQPL